MKEYSYQCSSDKADEQQVQKDQQLATCLWPQRAPCGEEGHYCHLGQGPMPEHVNEYMTHAELTSVTILTEHQTPESETQFGHKITSRKFTCMILNISKWSY